MWSVMNIYGDSGAYVVDSKLAEILNFTKNYYRESPSTTDHDKLTTAIF